MLVRKYVVLRILVRVTYLTCLVSTLAKIRLRTLFIASGSHVFHYLLPDVCDR